MRSGVPVPHGLVVPEELEGPVKRPGWNSCDQYLGRGRILLLAPVELWCNTCSQPSGDPWNISRKSCGNSVGALLNTPCSNPGKSCAQSSARYAYCSAFSTLAKLTSVGVGRPKIETITFRVCLSSFTSSTAPLKFANGPSVIRTCSPLANLSLSFGFSRVTSLRFSIALTSASESALG